MVDDGVRALTAPNALLQALGAGTLTSLGAISSAANQMPYWSGAGVMTSTGLTSAMRTLLASSLLSVSGSNLVTAAGARVTGEAITQSVTDLTAGRLLKVGDFGLSAAGAAVPNNNVDDITATGSYAITAGVVSGSTALTGISTSGSGFLHLAFDANSALQIMTHRTTGVTYVRTKSLGTWPFGPDLLDWSGIIGASYYADPDTMFSDAGTTLAGVGEAVRQINDRAGTGINGGQSTLANRPTRVRMPRDLRNILSSTSDFGAALWADTNATVTRGLPDRNGDPYAARVVPIAGRRALNADGLRHSSLIARMVSGPVTYAAEFKADGFPYAAIGLSNGSGLTVTAIFDLTTGAVLATGQHPSSGTGLSGSPESLGGGWWRCAITFQQGLTFPVPNLHLTGSSVFGSSVYARDIAGDGIGGVLVARPQVEIGSVATNPQIVVGNLSEVIEPDVEAFDYIHFPVGLNTLILSAFPAGFDGQVLVAGRLGSWVDDVSLSTGWSFGMGFDPYSYGADAGWRGNLRNGLNATG